MNAYSHSPADAVLVEAARKGDERAFAELVDRYSKPLVATAAAITGDIDAAHDIAQEAFVRAWFGLARVRNPEKFGSWIRTIARNQARSWVSKHVNVNAVDPEHYGGMPANGDSPQDAAERDEREQLVLNAVAKLSAESREILLLYYMSGVSTPHVAKQLGVGEPTVRQRLRRARAQLHKEVETIMADVIGDRKPDDSFSSSVMELLSRARQLFRRVDYAHAVPLLEHARDQAPKDTMVALLLAEAYTFGCGPDELKEDPAAVERALTLLRGVLDQEPGNMIARLRRAALRASIRPREDVITEHQQLIDRARGGPFEAVTKLELARRFLGYNEADQALIAYKDVMSRYSWLTCVLHSEMGVCHAMAGDVARALDAFHEAVDSTTPDAMDVLRNVSIELMGDSYWAFWSLVDNIQTRQCQNHAWLAGLSSVTGDMARAREHLRKALEYLDAEEIRESRPVLGREFLARMDEMFPNLAKEPEIAALREQLHEGQRT